jgi:TatD DNase family protein
MKYFDVHTHTNYNPLEGQAKEIADECKLQNIFYVDIGTDINTSALAVKHSQESTNVFATVGIHPSDINKIDVNTTIDEIETLLKENSKIVAVGETGLDYYRSNQNKHVQKIVFIRHIALAHKYKLPLMVHVRDAHDDMIEILKAHAKGLKIIIHCFTGNEELVKKYVNLGCYISINGIITFSNSTELRKAIHLIPINRLLSETDAP